MTGILKSAEIFCASADINVPIRPLDSRSKMVASRDSVEHTGQHTYTAGQRMFFCRNIFDYFIY